MLTTRHIKILTEEFRFFFYRLYCWLQQKAGNENQSAVLALDIDAQVTTSTRLLSEHCNYLRQALRRTPYWTKGHLLLGEAALKLDDVATGYACAKAIAILSPDRQRHKSDMLLARCYLRRGAFEHARKFFEQLLLISPDELIIKEDLAACLIGLGKFQQATELLSAIPEDAISAPGKAALLYSRKKMEVETQV